MERRADRYPRHGRFGLPFVNGQYVGQGPIRSWPFKRSTTRMTSPRTCSGEKRSAVRVHYGVGTFQYNCGPAGLWVRLVTGDVTWSRARLKTSIDPARHVDANISIQQAYEEQYDARRADGWQHVDYDDSAWRTCTGRRAGAGRGAACARDILHLTLEPVQPAVRERRCGAVHPTDLVVRVSRFSTADRLPIRGSPALATQIWSPRRVACLHRPHRTGL